ncbi:MAG: cell wall hydrolase [Opitutales bacterium]
MNGGRLERVRIFLLAFFFFALLSDGLTAKNRENYRPDPWERHIVASCLILEATGEGRRGMHAVMSVIVNRAEGEPSRIYAVVRRPWAFSVLNSATVSGESFVPIVRRASRDVNWGVALQIVDEAYRGELKDSTGGATHFVRNAPKRVYWEEHKVITRIIGNHRFLRKE